MSDLSPMQMMATLRFAHEHTATSLRINTICGSLTNYAEDKGQSGTHLLLGGLEATDMPFMVYAVIPKTLDGPESADNYDPIIDHLIVQLEKLRACAKAKMAKAQN